MAKKAAKKAAAAPAAEDPAVSAAKAADELGQVKARIAELEKEETRLRDQLVEFGAEAVEGSLFRVTVSRYESESINWKEIAAELKPTPKLVAKHTTTKERVTVKVNSR